MMYDVQLNGMISSFSASFLYAEHFSINDRLFFSLALEPGFIYKQFNTTGLIFPGMIDQGTGTVTGTYPLPAENGQKLIPDISFGILGQLDDVYFGLALHHLAQPEQSVINGDQSGRLPLKITLHAGAKSHEFHRGLFSRAYTLSPNLVYQQQGAFKQINGGISMKEDWFTFGLWYRNNLSARPNSVVAMVGYQTEKFQFGYSFDYTLSNLSVYSYGSHEISLIFYFGEYSRRLINRTMEIPQM
jgi:type IX secretion system PorP/SprF family membrane protein